MTNLLCRRRLALALGAGVLAGVLALVLWHEAGLSTPPERPAERPTVLAPTPGLPWFEDVTAPSGIAFRHFNSATPMHYIPETMGSGLAWIDYDNDGWPDLFCVQDGPLFPEKHSGPLPTHKLYRNNGDGTFRDVTEQVGLARSCYGMGCAVGDYDNDGWPDLAVTYLGGVALYHNEPDGRGGRRFVDVTAKVGGLADPHWATGCAWVDADGDGLLDLYVCNYCEIDLAHYAPCYQPDVKKPFHCSPSSFPAVAHKLFRNEGGHRFTDVSVPWGIAAASPAPGLGVLACDLDGDGLVDLYVANDMKAAYLFHNQGGGRFVDKGLASGLALDGNGRYISGMGVEAGDVDGSGRPSLFVTNFQHDRNVFFLNQGNLFFVDQSDRAALGPPSADRLSFGTVFVDVDLDGNLDVATATGHVLSNAPELRGDPFEQAPQLFLGDGRARFRDVSAKAGAYFLQKRVGRGLAWADFDNDGRPDLAFSNNGGALALLRNATATANHWLRLELVGDWQTAAPGGRKSSRDAVGARLEVEAGGRRLVRFVHGGGSYLSASDRRQLVGLGGAVQAERVTVQWPSGRRQEFGPLAGEIWPGA